MSSSPSPSPHLQLEITDAGEAELDEGYEFMGRFGFSIAERWLSGVQAALQRECELHATLSMRRPLAEEHFPGRDIFVLRYTSGGRRGGSPWRLLYELVDTDDDGQIDALRLIGVRHSARRSANDPPDEP